MSLKIVSLFGLLLTLWVPSQGQTPSTDIISKFKKPRFYAPEKSVQDKLYIPYLAGNLYGLCDYSGKIMLQPQFDDIDMTSFDPPFVLAKKNDTWSLYDFTGKSALPEDVKMTQPFSLHRQLIRTTGFTSTYVLNFQDPRPAYLVPMPKENKAVNTTAQIMVEEKPENTPPRNFYISKNAKPPFKSWFNPDNETYYKVTRKSNNYFAPKNNSEQYGFVKVMDENRRFTLLDENDMEPIFPTVFDCAAISPTKILILNENGLCALREMEKGWQTDFMFRNVKTTKNPEFCEGEAQIGDKVVKYKIDGNGNATLLENEYSWYPLDERYTRIGEKNGEYGTNFYLFDEKTGKNVRKLNTDQIAEIAGKLGVGIYEDGKLKGIETCEGDTLWSPPFTIRGYNDLAVIGQKGDTAILADKNLQVIYQIVADGLADMGYAGLFQVSKGKKLGMIDAAEREILPIAFDQILPMRLANRLLCRKNDLWGMFDAKTGEEILPVQFNHLRANGNTFWCGGGAEIRIGNDFFLLTPDLEIVYQKTHTPILTKQDFPLKNASEAAKADFENAKIPDEFKPYFCFKGNNWLHIFKNSGEHIASLEGFKDFRLVNIQSTESNDEASSLFQTGIAKLTPVEGKSVWVRLEDGFLYQEK